ncbi:MAG TPA: hypothetical protein VG722_06410, partial [Tepidisphaeraceae bacterium]|nr:hypothetical protein [Tepidisphaeraceae bacterium]
DLFLRRVGILVLFSLVGCQGRMVGQVELLGVRHGDQTLYHFGSSDAPVPKTRTNVLPTFGDPVRLQQDVVTVQVDSAYIRDLPPRLTGSKDVVLFAEIQQDAAIGYGGEKTTSIVYVGKNQRIPGRLNFNGNLVYGPAAYSGHPPKIKFTLMVLQSAAANQEQSVINVISNLAGAAAPQYAGVSSTVAAAVRDILLAQPDIVAFDYEATFLSDHPGVAVVATEDSAENPSRPWLRYGRYVLLETLGYKSDSQSLWNWMQPSDIFFDGVALRDKTNNRALPANYLVFSVVPGQISEEDATLSAASDQSERLLSELRQPETQTATAITDIVDQSKNMLLQVMRSRAAAIAAQAVRTAEAQVPTTQPAERNSQITQLITQRFDQQWLKLISNLPAGNPDSATLNQIRQEVLQQWEELYQER